MCISISGISNVCLATTLLKQKIWTVTESSVFRCLCNTFCTEFYSIAHDQEIFLVAAAEK